MHDLLNGITCLAYIHRPLYQTVFGIPLERYEIGFNNVNYFDSIPQKGGFGLLLDHTTVKSEGLPQPKCKSKNKTSALSVVEIL
ncbi:hypothetical protein GEMRC1_006261 [Eukaryota sp. GEM-RC1]